MVDYSRIGNSIYGAVKTGVEESIQIVSQTNPFTNFVSDVWGFGYQGGPLESKDFKEIILRNGKIIGFRDYKDGEGRPIEFVNDLQTDEGEFVNCGGRVVKGPGYDTDFERWGSASRLTDGDYRSITDKSTIVQEIMKDALSWYVGKGGKRRYLKNPDGTTNNEYLVVEIPRAKQGFLEKFDPKGFDAGAAGYFGLQSLIYMLFDRLVYDPIVERPIRKINAGLKKKDLPQIRLDPFVETEYIAVSEIANGLLGLPSEKELYATE